MESVGCFYTQAFNVTRSHYLDRINEILEVAKNAESLLIKLFPDCKGLTLICSMERLDTAITSYFYDIHRYKHFHGMLDDGKESNINYAKVYAFTAKWLIKEMPFTLKIAVDTSTLSKNYIKYANYINEIILILWMKSSFKALLNEDLIFSIKEEQKLRYSFRYREISTSFLEMFLLTKFPKNSKKIPPLVSG